MVKIKGYPEEIFDHSNIFILPSKVEGFGLVVLEAINNGLPVICTNNGGMVEIAQDYSNGFIIEYGNIKQLAKTIIEVSKK